MLDAYCLQDTCQRHKCASFGPVNHGYSLERTTPQFGDPEGYGGNDKSRPVLTIFLRGCCFGVTKRTWRLRFNTLGNSRSEIPTNRAQRSVSGGASLREAPRRSKNSDNLIYAWHLRNGVVPPQTRPDKIMPFPNHPRRHSAACTPVRVRERLWQAHDSARRVIQNDSPRHHLYPLVCAEGEGSTSARSFHRRRLARILDLAIPGQCETRRR